MHLCIKGWSYFENETQLLTFRKDLLPYLAIPHFLVLFRSKNKKVDGGDWGGDFWRFAVTKNFFFLTGAPPHPIETSAVLSRERTKRLRD